MLQYCDVDLHCSDSRDKPVWVYQCCYLFYADYVYFRDRTLFHYLYLLYMQKVRTILLSDKIPAGREATGQWSQKWATIYTCQTIAALCLHYHLPYLSFVLFLACSYGCAISRIFATRGRLVDIPLLSVDNQWCVVYVR